MLGEEQKSELTYESQFLSLSLGSKISTRLNFSVDDIASNMTAKSWNKIQLLSGSRRRNTSA